MENAVLIGIAGGSASGKTTLARNIAAEFGDKVVVISHDNYYRAHPGMTITEKVLINYDHPDAFETDLFLSHLRTLKSGGQVEMPIYDYVIHDRTDKTVTVSSRSVIVVEGILIFSDPRVVDLLDLRLFVDTEADLRLVRRIRRDVEERGRTLSAVLSQYERTVKPMHDAFVEPSKRVADLIVPGGGDNPAAKRLIFAHIRELLGEE